MTVTKRVPRLIRESSVELITLDEARLHLRLDTYDSPAQHPDDALVSALITVAREWAESFTGLSLINRTLELALDSFPGWYRNWYASGREAIELPRGPVQTILFMEYDSDSSTVKQITDYQFDNTQSVARIVPAPNACWPTSYIGKINTIRIRYVAGYSGAYDSPSYEVLPKKFKQAMLLCIAHWYENREDTSMVDMKAVPMASQALLRSSRVEKSMA